MCQKGGNREGIHDRSDDGYCRTITENGNDLSNVVVDVYLKNHRSQDEKCACRGIWVMLRLEADALADTEYDSPFGTKCAHHESYLEWYP
jgi:hypothetical protein